MTRLVHVVLFAAQHFVLLHMFEQGLVFERGTVRAQLRRSVFWRAVLVALFAAPLIAIATVRLLPTTPLAAGVLVVMAICPGNSMLIFAAAKRGGEVRLALSLALVLSVLSVVTVPLWLRVISAIFPVSLHAPALGILKHLAPELLLPLLAGLVIRGLVPRAARRIAWVVEKLFFAGLLCAAVVLLVVVGREVAEAHASGVLAGTLVMIATLLAGWAAGGPEPRDRTTVGITALYGNPAIALYVAGQSFPELHLEPAIFAYVLWRAFVVLLFARWSRSRREASPGAPRGTAPA